MTHGKFTVFCECRTIDDNFLKLYNKEGERRVPIPECPTDALVIGKWYRDALGRIGTKQDVSLSISAAKIPGWRALRAASHHPDFVVRLATYLGAIAVCLGILGFLVAVLPSNASLFGLGRGWISFVFALAVGGIGARACWPIKR